MPSISYSVSDFKQILRDETQSIANENGWDWNSEVRRGYSFQIWAAQLITGYEQEFETEPDEAVLFSNDLKADLVLEDSVNSVLLICQCKFTGISKRIPNVDEDEVVSFFDRHTFLWIDHGLRIMAHMTR